MKKNYILIVFILVSIMIFAPIVADAKDKDCEGKNEFVGFSGKTELYKDSVHGYQIKIPVEFKLNQKGDTTDWIGPILDSGATTISINTVLMQGVPSQTLYKINFDQKKKDKKYTQVKPFKVPGKGKVYAFMCKETSKNSEGKDKDGQSIHRWHMFIFGNSRFYTCGFSGRYGSFTAGKVQKMFNSVMKSIKLIPVK